MHTTDSQSSCCSGNADQSPSNGSHRDPVCGMQVNPEKAAGICQHAGTTYYFCSRHCVDKFQADPGRFLDPKPAPMPPPAAPGTRYTCPMDPQIIQIGPGTCPICGMALEPMDATAEEDLTEVRDMTRRLIWSAILSVPVIYLAMIDPMTGFPVVGMLGTSASLWIQAVLSGIISGCCGWPILKRAAISLKTMNFNMFTLIALGVLAAWGFSVFGMLFPHLLPHSERTDSHGPPVYFESAAVITALVLLGQMLEGKARHQTGGAIRGLLKLRPDQARRINPDQSETLVATDQIRAGDRLRILPGHSIPADGTIEFGSGLVDESMISGEPIPVEKQPGHRLIGGTLSRSGSFILKIDRVGDQTVLSQIVRYVAEAQRSRAPIQNLADRVARWFVPAIIALSCLTFGLWMILGPEPRWAFALTAAVSVLIIACPCALGLATPVSIVVGMGKAARNGILIRNAEALQTLSHTRYLLLDKTGTLTEGKPTVQNILPADGIDPMHLLHLAGSLEKASEHPLADAILKAAQAQSVELAAAENIRVEPGLGLSGTVDGVDTLLGNQSMLEKRKITVPQSLRAESDALLQTGATLIWIAQAGHCLGVIAAHDPVKPDAARCMALLKSQGIQPVLVSGDQAPAVHAVARKLAIQEVHAGVLPEEKAAVVRRYQSGGQSVAMAGDGINDAPALAAADAGIAMGNGSDLAIETADVTLLKGDLKGLLRAHKLSRKTLANIRQNLMLAFGYNLLAVPVAAGLLYPFTGTLLSPMIAAAAMSLSSVSVIGNALRLKNLDLRDI